MPDDLRNRIAADIKEAASDPGYRGEDQRDRADRAARAAPDEFAKEIEVQSKVVSDAAAAAGVKRMLQN